MRKEIEVKARIQNPETLIKMFVDFGCVFSAPIYQEDRVFVKHGEPFPCVKGQNTLRIRKSDDQIILTLKQIRSNGLDKLEHEVMINDVAEMENILKVLDYQEVSLARKTRRKANYKDYEICVDVVDELGSFVEVEKIADDVDSEKIQDEMFAFLLQFGVKPEDRALQGYDVLLHQKGKQQI